MERLDAPVLRHRWLVLAAWLVLLVASAAAASGLSDLLTNRFTLPGTETRARRDDPARTTSARSPTGSFTLVVARRAGPAAALVAAARARPRARAAAELPTGRFVGVAAGLRPTSPRATIVSELAAGRREGPHRRACARRPGRFPARELYVTGQAAIEHDLEPVFVERPQGRRALHRDPDRAADPRLRLRDARLPAPVPVRRVSRSRRRSGSSGSSRTTWS